MAMRAEQPFSTRALSKAMVDLPALPTVVLQVMRASEKEDVRTAEIEGYICADTALSVKLLKVVNSAYFGLPRQVTSIGQAIGILGLSRVRSLVLTVGVLNALSTPNPTQAQMRQEFWKVTFTAAAAAQLVAKKMALDVRSQELAFIGALLADVGRLFILTIFPNQYQQCLIEADRNSRSLVEAEQRVLGMDHAALGAQLAERWAFPVKLAEIIRTHEFPEGDNLVARCVHAADRLAAELTNPNSAAEVWPWDPAVDGWLDPGVRGEETMQELAKALEASESLLNIA
jgi:HD-like signal output (HDOD) protein